MPFHLNSALLCHALIENGVNVLGFYDNNDELNGKFYSNFEIKIPEQAALSRKDVAIIICHKRYEDELSKQMIKLGYSEFLYADELEIFEFLRNYETLLDAASITALTNKLCGHFYDNKTRCDAVLVTLKDYFDVIQESISVRAENNGHCRKALLISHELTYTGAPIALYYAAKALDGIVPIIFCEEQGELMDELLKDNIPVLIDRLLLSREWFEDFAGFFDLVIVNTTQGVQYIELLGQTNVPVLWWIHEAHQFYADSILHQPKELCDNIHVYCAGEYARSVFLSNMPPVETGILMCAVPDQGCKNSAVTISENTRKFRFMTVGKIAERKGYDVFCSAIRLMDSNTRAKCEFVMIGSKVSPEYYDKILAVKRDYPESVILIDRLSRDDIYDAIRQCDCMVCPSRDEPGPLYIVEAMVYNKICICSESAGIASLIEDGVSGFVYSQNDPVKLFEKMMFVIDNYDKLEHMKKNSRAVYDKYFRYDIFSGKLMHIVDTLMSNRKLGEGFCEQ